MKAVNRRLRCFIIPGEMLINALLNWQKFDYLQFLKVEGVPEDAQLVNMEYCMRDMGFLAIYTHSDFKELAVGECIPTESGVLQETIRLQKVDLPLPRPATDMDIRDEIYRLMNYLDEDFRRSIAKEYL